MYLPSHSPSLIFASDRLKAIEIAMKAVNNQQFIFVKVLQYSSKRMKKITIRGEADRKNVNKFLNFTLRFLRIYFSLAFRKSHADTRKHDTFFK